MTTAQQISVWKTVAAPFPTSAVEWRQDGKMFLRDGKPFGRFVAYVGANAVRARLDETVAGEWTIALELLPIAADADGAVTTVFKARLTINGIFREDVGVGRDAKAASSDAMKRAAARFGIGAELHRMFAIVQLESEQKYAKPIEPPQTVHDRRNGGSASPAPARVSGPSTRAVRPPAPLVIDPRVPRGAQAPARVMSPEPPPPDDEDGVAF